MWKYGLFLVATLSLGFAPAPFPKPDPTKADLKKLQGTWMKVRAIPPGNGEGVSTLVFTEKHMRYHTPINGMVMEYSLTLDARKKPKVFDFTTLTEGFKGAMYRGTYQLDGDTLTICYRMSHQESDRPNRIDAVGDDVIISVYKRQKR
jgi:uncharacterized protein (TIGR03067 family)